MTTTTGVGRLSDVSAPMTRLSITFLTCALMWFGLTAHAAPGQAGTAAMDQESHAIGETTDPPEDDSTDTTAVTETTETTGSSGTDSGSARAATASWWQWLLGAALVIGAAGVIRLAANRPPDPATIGLDAQSLLAHYQETAASVVRTTPPRGGYAYELGVLDTLAPRLDALIDAARADSRDGLLVAVRSRALETVESMRAMTAEGGGIDAQLRVTKAGAELEQAIQRARAEF
ncbi:MAG: hypothetical protein OEX04_04420 [Acidimicrobiia bacterium]|nr:hypothetical protein [Acidimicrobiia bacterium]MDH4306700.1 hypothetical protein [Acidimicrobiia bacterium]MDH5292671.1 hypothetical protein [Acidimicrobiia bacterium]